MTNLGQSLIRRWHWLLEGRAEAPEQRMHLGFMFAAALGCFAGAALNYFGALTSAFFVLVLTLAGLALLAIWAYSRRLERAQSPAMLCCVLALIALLPLNWLYNQGMNGPSLLLFLVVAGYAFGVLLIGPWQRLLLAALFLVVPYLMIWVDYRSPGLIAPYPSRAQHAIDAALTYTICVGLLLVMVSGFFRRFESEQRVIQSYTERLRETARRDSLTGLLNHGAFYSLVDAYCRREDRDDTVALTLYDLDHFKTTNDTYGHVYGDETLRLFARVLRELVNRHGGVAGRCGGEEFAVFLPDTSRADVERIDATLRDTCRREPLLHGAVQFSGGVALRPAANVTQWMETADQALYAAKCRGRDQTVFASDAGALNGEGARAAMS